MRGRIWRRSACGVSTMLLVMAGVASSHDRSGPKPVLDPVQGDGGVSTFYVWDKEVPGTPGKILRQEPLPDRLMVSNASKGVRVLYSSTNGIDSKTPITVSGAVYFPKGTPPAGGWPVVGWAHGTTGVADVCAPSWTPANPAQADYFNALLAEGYAIAATDYQGLGTPGAHPWMLARPEGWSVLDSVRSALDAFPALSDSVIIAGWSQGAHAAASAALMAKEYAPSIMIKGTILTGVPGSPPYIPATSGSQIAARSSSSAFLAALRLFTFMAVDPAFRPSDYLSDAGAPVFEAARTACVATILESAARNHVTRETLMKKFPDDVAAKAAPYQQYPTLRFSQPVFVATGLDDMVVFPESQYNFVRTACEAGSRVETHYYPGKDHISAVNAMQMDSIAFVKRALAGQPAANNCKSLKPPQ